MQFQFTESDYRGPETPNALTGTSHAPVTLSKQRVSLANPVAFRITPLTEQQAQDRGLSLPEIPDDDPNFPNRAGT